MAQQNIQPKADQPRVTAKDAARGNAPATLTYRIQGVKSFDRGPVARKYGRTVRG